MRISHKKPRNPAWGIWVDGNVRIVNLFRKTLSGHN